MTKIPLEHILVLIKDSISLGQVITRCGYKASGTYYKYLNKLIKTHNIDISHFLGKHHNRGKRFGPKRDINDYLSGQYFINTHTLKLRLIKEGLKEHKCEVCAITEWCGKPTPIQLDHIDGNNQNNQLENLRILCPNCHAQTDTYCGKSNRKIKYCICGEIKKHKTKLCKSCSLKQQYKNIKNTDAKNNNYDYCECGNPKISKSKVCQECNNKLPKLHCRKVDRPTKEELLVLIQTKPFVQIGKMYGVSDNAVRKWCKIYGLPHRSKDIVKILE